MNKMPNCVTEGNNVTLTCRNKTTSSNLTADFYKEGVHVGSTITGNMIIHSVSKCEHKDKNRNISI